MASSNQTRLKEAMAGGSGSSKGPHEPDGELTDDTASGIELPLSDGAPEPDDEQPSSSYLEPAAGQSSTSWAVRFSHFASSVHAGRAVRPSAQCTIAPLSGWRSAAARSSTCV